jgi:hypothetical protein
VDNPLVWILIMVAIMIVVARRAAGGYDRLIAKGIPARGILLWVATTGTRSGVAPRRFETRNVRMDIEIPGQAPYEAEVSPIIPASFVRDILPGATVELRIARRDRTRIAVVGPGAGFAVATLNATPARKSA